MGIRGSRYINTYASSSAAKLRKSEGDRETEKERQKERERQKDIEKERRVRSGKYESQRKTWKFVINTFFDRKKLVENLTSGRKI